MEPVRCFTCNAVLHFSRFAELSREAPEADSIHRPAWHALEAMHVTRYCCRRMYITHPVELEALIRSHPLLDVHTETYSMKFESAHRRTVSTD